MYYGIEFQQRNIAKELIFALVLREEAFLMPRKILWRISIFWIRALAILWEMVRPYASGYTNAFMAHLSLSMLGCWFRLRRKSNASWFPLRGMRTRGGGEIAFLTICPLIF